VPATPSTGTVVSDGRSAPVISTAEYRPATAAIRSGKCSFTRCGSVTLPMAIPDMDSTEAARNTGVESVRPRTSSPRAVAVSARAAVRCTPMRLPMAFVLRPTTAKQRTGRVVRTPATLPEKPTVSPTCSREMPRLVIEGRRLSARATMPTSVSQRVACRRPRPTGAGLSARMSAVTDAW